MPRLRRPSSMMEPQRHQEHKETTKIVTVWVLCCPRTSRITLHALSSIVYRPPSSFVRPSPDSVPGRRDCLLQLLRLLAQRLIVVGVGVALDEAHRFSRLYSCGNCQHGGGSAVVEGCLRVPGQEFSYPHLLSRHLLKMPHIEPRCPRHIRVPLTDAGEDNSPCCLAIHVVCPPGGRGRESVVGSRSNCTKCNTQPVIPNEVRNLKQFNTWAFQQMGESYRFPDSSLHSE